MANQDEDFLGLKPGQSIPMERHGEMGQLYRPITNLTKDELVLYCKACGKAEEAELPDTRDSLLKVLREEAVAAIADADAREVIIQHVMAFADEMAGIS